MPKLQPRVERVTVIFSVLSSYSVLEERTDNEDHNSIF